MENQENNEQTDFISVLIGLASLALIGYGAYIMFS